jgi:hypothetical protein
MSGAASNDRGRAAPDDTVRKLRTGVERNGGVRCSPTAATRVSGCQAGSRERIDRPAGGFGEDGAARQDLGCAGRQP